MDEMGLIDIWRDFYPSSCDYTHFSAPHSTYSRIDYFFTFSKDRYKKINSSILNYTKIKQQFKNEIDLYFEENDKGDVSPSILWDAYKAVIRGKIIACTSLIKKQKREKLVNLQMDLKEIQRQYKNSQDNDKNIEIKRLQNEIDAIYTDETQKSSSSLNKTTM